jgi:hypothetical protein
MKPDFGDMRFAWYNSSCEEWYELPYWIENLVNYTHVDIWVKVPNIPANNQTKIRMYYGNNYAINRSNGYNVFYVFDDFEIYNSTNDLVKIWTNVS